MVRRLSWIDSCVDENSFIAHGSIDDIWDIYYIPFLLFMQKKENYSGGNL